LLSAPLVEECPKQMAGERTGCRRGIFAKIDAEGAQKIAASVKHVLKIISAGGCHE
jgi:hypothetical protein